MQAFSRIFGHHRHQTQQMIAAQSLFYGGHPLTLHQQGKNHMGKNNLFAQRVDRQLRWNGEVFIEHPLAPCKREKKQGNIEDLPFYAPRATSTDW